MEKIPLDQSLTVSENIELRDLCVHFLFLFLAFLRDLLIGHVTLKFLRKVKNRRMGLENSISRNPWLIAIFDFLASKIQSHAILSLR